MEALAMGIDWFRDLVICIFGLVAAGVLIFIAAILYSLYRRTKALLDTMQERAKTTQGIASYIGDEILQPVIQMVALVQGIRRGIYSVSKFFKKEEGGRNE
jgi:hypothetical protein